MKEKPKREWWPIGIVMAMLTFIGGVLFAVSIMVRNDVPLTSDDYYAREIAYQGEIEKTRRGLQPSERPVVRMITEGQTVEITFPGRKGASTFEGKATFFRPSDPKQDFAVQLVPDTAGVQVVMMADRQPGLWSLQLEWSQDGTPYYYEEPLIH